MVMKYNAPPTTASSIGPTKQTFMRRKKSVIEARDYMYFSQLSKTEYMPKHMGKKIEVYEYIPLLDERNINDQGLDANGVATLNPDGNIYGSSRDIGVITARIPDLSEDGGMVNRVGFTRVDRSATLNELGFFFDFTKDQYNFDDDPELFMHLDREAITGAVQMNEAYLQIDLLNGAGVVQFTGDATQDSEMTGETGTTVSKVVYTDLDRLRVTLDQNKTPTDTKIIAGSNLTDTKTIPACRLMYVSPDLINMLRHMTDTFNNPAFIPVEKYADKSNVLPGEQGTISGFRIIQNNEMLHWAGAGADVTTNAGYKATGDKYDIYPMLVVGSESFVTIGFQGDGKNQKFHVITKKPSDETADAYNDPYGKKGFQSISWFYATLILRPERIAIIKTVAPQ